MREDMVWTRREGRREGGSGQREKSIESSSNLVQTLRQERKRTENCLRVDLGYARILSLSTIFSLLSQRLSLLPSMMISFLRLSFRPARRLPLLLLRLLLVLRWPQISPPKANVIISLVFRFHERQREEQAENTRERWVRVVWLRAGLRSIVDGLDGKD